MIHPLLTLKSVKVTTIEEYLKIDFWVDRKEA